MSKENENMIIGCEIEYRSRAKIYTGIVMDKINAIDRDIGNNYPYTLYLVKDESGQIFKISPVQVIRILRNQ